MALSVFISSTAADLREHRAQVNAAISRLRLRPIDMVNFGSQEGGAVGVSVKEVRNADIYVGIIAHRYGYIPAGMTKSVTEQEYDEAVRLRLPRLMYLVDPKYDWPPEFVEQGEAAQKGLAAFRAHVEANEVRSLFTTPENLASQVASDLARMLAEQQRGRVLRWVAAAIVALALVIVLGLIAFPDTRSSVIAFVGLGTATYTPTATLTPTLTPTITPTPTPTPNPRDAFRIGVSYFDIPDDGSVDAAQADRLVDAIYAGLHGELTEFGGQIGLQIGFVEPQRIGRIQAGAPDPNQPASEQAQTAENEREDQAQALAEGNAFGGIDILLYGSITKNDAGFLDVTPEFYVNKGTFSEGYEMSGTHRFGDAVLVDNTRADILAANDALRVRTETTARVFSGLIYFILKQDYQQALSAFEDANQQLEAFFAPNSLGGRVAGDQGREVLFVLIGNTYAKLGSEAAQSQNLDTAQADLKSAIEAYNSAISIKKNYSRPYTGIASAEILQYNAAFNATGKPDIQLLQDAQKQLQDAQNYAGSADSGIQLRQEFAALQIDFYFWLFHRSDITEAETSAYFEDFQNKAHLILDTFNDAPKDENSRALQELASETNYLLGLADSKNNACETAVKEFDQARQLSNDARRRMFFYEAIGDCYNDQLSDPDIALENYQKALAQGQFLIDRHDPNAPTDSMQRIQDKIDNMNGRG